MAMSTSLALLAVATLFSAPVNAGLYPKSSAVLSITGKTYDRLIAQSNHTSVSFKYFSKCGILTNKK
jgi:protein disulfide-isomerase A6